VLRTNGGMGRGSAPVDLSAIPVAVIDHIDVLCNGDAAQLPA
jgi:iron complex outermembrane receptor protein